MKKNLLNFEQKEAECKQKLSLNITKLSKSIKHKKLVIYCYNLRSNLCYKNLNYHFQILLVTQLPESETLLFPYAHESIK